MNNYQGQSYYNYQNNYQQQQNNSQWLFAIVNGERGMEEFAVPPSCRAMLMDSNSPSFWNKIANEFGQIVSKKRYKFEEFVEVQQQTPQYVTYDEFAKLRESIDKLVKEVGNESSTQ